MKNNCFIDQYIDSITHLPQLSGDEVTELVVEFQNGKTHVADRLLAQFAKMFHKIISKHSRSLSGEFTEHADDMFNQSVLIMMECLNRFDASAGLQLSTYLHSSVNFAMMSYVKKSANQVNPWVNARWAKLATAITAWMASHHSDVTDTAAWEFINKLCTEHNEDPQYAMGVFTRLKSTTANELPAITDTDHIADCSNHESTLDHDITLGAVVNKMDNVLDARSRFAVKRYFMSKVPVTLNTVAKEMGCSMPTVRELINKAIVDLQTNLGVDYANVS